MTKPNELPLYQCHKQVRAAKILKVEEIAFSDTYDIRLKTDAGNVVVPGGWARKYKPQPGGYYVLYVDGYASYSPAAAFEAGYSLVGANSLMTFGQALEKLKNGAKIARAGWNGRGMWLRLLEPYAPHPEDAPDAHPRNPYFRAADNNVEAVGTMLPWIGMKTADNKFVPWLASQTDMLADDWRVVE